MAPAYAPGPTTPSLQQRLQPRLLRPGLSRFRVAATRAWGPESTASSSNRHETLPPPVRCAGRHLLGGCRRGRPRPGPAEHLVDHLRGYRAAARVLRGRVRHHPQSRPLGREGNALHARVVHGTGVRPRAHDDHQRALSRHHGLRTHAQPRPATRRVEDVPPTPARRRLLLYEQREGGLQPGETGQGLGRILPPRALDQPPARPALLCDLQPHRHPREPGANSTPHAGS